MHVGSRDVSRAQAFFDRRIMLLEQREKNVLGTHVKMIVVAALLLGSAKNSARRRAEL